MAMTVSELTVKVNADTRDAESGLSSLGGKLGSIGGGLATAFGGAAIAGIAAVGGAFVASGVAAAGFEAKMSAIKAVSGATGAEMFDLQNKALELGAATSFSASEAAVGIAELVKAGVSIGDVMGGGAAGALSLAAAGAIEVKDAAEITSNALNAFGLSGEHAVHVADQIAGAANASAIDVNDFKFSLAAVGAVANTVGFTFEDTTAAIALLGNAGIKGADAGTSLKTMFLNLQPTTKAQIGLFRELGLTTADGGNAFFDATGKVKSMSEVAGTLQTALAGMTQQQKLAALEVIFGSDAIRAAAVFSKEGAAGIDKMTESIAKISAADVAKERLNNLAGSLEQLKGSLETAAIQIGLQFTPRLKELVDSATTFVNDATPALLDFAGVISEAMSDAGAALALLPDAWRTAKEAFAGQWLPSDQIPPFVNAVGIAVTKAKEFGDGISGAWDTLKKNMSDAWGIAKDRGVWDTLDGIMKELRLSSASVGDRMRDMGKAFETLSSGAGKNIDTMKLLGLAIKVVALDLHLLVIGMAQSIDAWMTMATVGLNSLAMWKNVGVAIQALARGDLPGASAALRDAKGSFDTAAGAADDFARNSVDRVKTGTGIIKEIMETEMEAAAVAAGKGMSRASAHVGTGAGEMQRFMEENVTNMASIADSGFGQVADSAASNMPALATATEAGASGAVAALEGAVPSMAAAAEAGATGAVAAVDGQTAAAAAAGTAMGTGMATGVETGAAGMASAAEAGASGAVAAVQGQTGAASGAGQSLGEALGSGLEGGIMAYVGRVANAAARLVGAAIGAARAEAQAESPSKKTEKLGKDMADGMELGLSKSGLGAEMQKKIRDFIEASRDYIPVAGQIKRVEDEIKTIRYDSQVAALFRAKEMITLDSEVLRLKEDMVRKERDLLPLRQDLARAGREIAEAERGSLADRERAISLSGTLATQNVKVNEEERKKIPLRQAELEIERQLLGLDPAGKRAKVLKEEQEEIRKKLGLIDNTIAQIRIQTRAEELDVATTKDMHAAASTGARIRAEGLAEQTKQQEVAIQAIKDQIEVLGSERGVFEANENVIKNATQNEIDYRSRLIAVFTAEGKPLADRITAGLLLIDQLEKEGKISKELASKLRDIAKGATDGKGATVDLGNAAATATPQMDAAAKKAAEMAAGAQAIAEQAKAAASKVDALSSSLGKLPDWFRPNVEPIFRPRANGGPVGAGLPYLVGERGREMFVPTQSGTIMPADQTRAMLSGDSFAAGGTQTVRVDVAIGGRVAEQIYVEGRDLAIRRGRES